jgi:ATP-dependent Clp protease adapter protein ClpS
MVHINYTSYHPAVSIQISYFSKSYTLNCVKYLPTIFSTYMVIFMGNDYSLFVMSNEHNAQVAAELELLQRPGGEAPPLYQIYIKDDPRASLSAIMHVLRSLYAGTRESYAIHAQRIRNHGHIHYGRFTLEVVETKAYILREKCRQLNLQLIVEVVRVGANAV